jgi:allantoinase
VSSRIGIASDRVLIHHAPTPGLIVIEDGIIVDVLDRNGYVGGPVADVGDLVVMPALIDTNVNISDPGHSHWEGFANATSAAAAGGVAVLIDMPLNSIPRTVTATGLARKKAASRGLIRVDVGFWGGIVPGNLIEVPLLADAGAVGFATALIDSGLGDPDSIGIDDLEGAMRATDALGLPLLVDAEAPGPLMAAPVAGDDYPSFLLSRPDEAEVEAIAALIDTAYRTNGWAHILHLSSADSLPMLAEARAAGVRITVETCPHYLTVSAEDIPDDATEYKCSPPIRSADNRERLWQGLWDGTIDMVVSDHSPCPPEFKRGGFARAWSGISSLELRLAVMWTEASRRGIGMRHLVRWLSEAPAALAQLPTGAIEPGRRADLVAWDPDAEFVVDPDRLLQRHHLTPYAGDTLRGVVHHTWSAGQMVFADRQLVPAAEGELLES